MIPKRTPSPLAAALEGKGIPAWSPGTVLFDLRNISLADLDAIEIDTSDQEVRVKLARHMGTGLVEYVETLPIDNDMTHPDLLAVREATRVLFEKVRDAIAHRAIESGEMPCATCTGACCRSWDVLVTDTDLRRLDDHGHLDLFERFRTPDMNGSVGRMRKGPWKNPKTKETESACAALGKDGLCTIYEARPTICRAFSPWACDEKEEWDPPKKRRLKVLT